MVGCVQPQDMHSPQGVVAAGLSDDAAERRPTVSPRVTRPPGERGLAEMYSDRVSQGRTPSSPRDHILFGGNRANHQAGTKFAAGGFPYLFVIVSGRAQVHRIWRLRQGQLSTDKRVLGAGNDAMDGMEGRAFAGLTRGFV